jgi:hypothetical protein
LAGASGENPALEAQIMNIFEPTETAPKILVADDDPAIVRLLADR